MSQQGVKLIQSGKATSYLQCFSACLVCKTTLTKRFNTGKHFMEPTKKLFHSILANVLCDHLSCQKEKQPHHETLF